MLSACTSTQTANTKAIPTADRFEVKNAGAAMILGHQRMSLGEYSAALSYYNQAAVQGGLTPDILSAMGSARLMLGQLVQAERLLRLAIEKDDAYAPAWNNLGVALANTGQLQEAARVFKVAFALSRGRSESVQQNLIKVLSKIEDNTYTGPTETNEFELVRLENGRFLLLNTPTTE